MKKFTSTESQNDYYWTTLKKNASRRYEDKMLSLVDGDATKLTVTLHDAPYDHYYVYMLDSIVLPDHPWMRYDFMIEYDLREPNVGIYYGCRCVSEWESEHPFDLDIALANRHWNEVRGEVIRVLKATFPDKDFSQEIYDDTDNANDFTYWPFWLRLQPADDIKEIGVGALRLVRNVYADYLNLPTTDKRSQDLSYIYQRVKTRFTYKNYSNLIKRVASAVKTDEDTASEFLKNFIAVCEKKGWLYKDPTLECAYRFKSCFELNQSSGCAFLIYSFMKYLNEKIKKSIEYPNIPWESWSEFILSDKGKPWTSNALRTRISKRVNRDNNKKGETFDDVIARINNEITSMIEDYI